MMMVCGKGVTFDTAKRDWCPPEPDPGVGRFGGGAVVALATLAAAKRDWSPLEPLVDLLSRY